MPYKKDKSGKILMQKIDGFWHPLKEDGTIGKIKGSTKQKAMNAIKAYLAVKYGKRK